MAILHFTGPPSIGGIESLMARQCAALARLGHRAVCVVGRGSGLESAEAIEIPAMDPTNDEVERSNRELAGVLPNHRHPLVQELVAGIGSALDGCTDCWIHNALTVSLNPYLTCALRVLIEQRSDVTWVAWCADLSSTSRFVESRVGLRDASSSVALLGVTWVAISETRRHQLSTALGLPAHRIRVVRPPLDIVDWLNIGAEARTILAATRLLESDLVVLVPAKALPHKRLDRAVGVAAALARDLPSFRLLITAASSPHEPNLSTLVRDRLRRAVREAGIQHGVQLLPDLVGEDPEDRTVRELMQLSDVVFLPSAEEGFGMPLLEAAACRVPIVCTDIAVFREVAGDSARYFREDWSDERVASLLVSAAGVTGSPQRRSALRSMRRFEADLESLLRMSAHPKV